MDFIVPVGHKVNIKESEKIDKNLDLARKLKMQWNMKVTVIPIVCGALGTVPKLLEKVLKTMGKIKTINAGILGKVLETCGDLLPLRLLGKPLVKTEVLNNDELVMTDVILFDLC